MTEVWQTLAGLPPQQIALATFGLGSVFGSFGYATFLRLAAGESLLGPRSRCPCCTHSLGASELVPVFSFLWLGGRCRLCRVRIPVSYPLTELALGGAAAFGGYVQGWAGGAGVISVGLVGAVMAGLWRRHRTTPRGARHGGG